MPCGWRADGDLVRDVPPIRRALPLLMPRRNEAAVYFEQRIDVAPLLAFLGDVRARTGLHATVLHAAVLAAARVLRERPRLNRFVAGGRLYQRRGIWVSLSLKRHKSDDHAIATVKRRVDPQASLADIVRDLGGAVERERGGPASTTERELRLLARLPVVLVRLALWLARRLDALGLLPRAFIDSDPLFASIFVANLGSLGMDACYHHLYEVGTIPIFMAIGRVRDEVAPGPGGEVRVRRVLPVRYTFDERIEDALYCLRGLERLQELLERPEQLAETG